MNDGEREAFLKQVTLYVGATEKKLASIGLPVRVALLRPDNGCVLTQAELIELVEKK